VDFTGPDKTSTGFFSFNVEEEVEEGPGVALKFDLNRQTKRRWISVKFSNMFKDLGLLLGQRMVSQAILKNPKHLVESIAPRMTFFSFFSASGFYN
jgi:hypothetical protein